MREDRVRVILDLLDPDCYGKNCNYLCEDKLIDNMPSFYSRDYCRNISFKELLEWYIKRLGRFENDCYLEEGRVPTEEEVECHNKMVENQLKLFMELIDIYSVYRVMSKLL